MTTSTHPALNQVASENLRASLASELAIGMLPIPDILKRFGMTTVQLKQLLRDQTFKNMVKQFKAEWHEASNSKERIRLKAAIMVEENLVELHRIFNDIEMNPSTRLEAFKQMTTLADVQPRHTGPDNSGPKFNLTLNLGDTSKSLTIDAVAEELNGND